MKYDMSNALHREQLQKRLDKFLKDKQGIVEFTEVKPKRTIKQNNYLHLILGFFACEYGESIDYVKEYYFKYAANKELFLRIKEDKLLGNRGYLRSSSELTTEEMTLAIERFRDWSSINAGIYLPSSDEHRLLELADIEVSRNKQYL